MTKGHLGGILVGGGGYLQGQRHTYREIDFYPSESKKETTAPEKKKSGESKKSVKLREESHDGMRIGMRLATSSEEAVRFFTNPEERPRDEGREE